jgi:hypothetical protein
MPNDVIISILEDYVGNHTKIEIIAQKYNISVTRIQFYIDLYNGFDKLKLRSLKRKRTISELNLENYKSNNLTIITDESLISTL